MTGERKRCAIYTRKSSEEGLDQDFNSLQAQREACEAFVLSQRHEGWQINRTEYDDGGLSGGHMDRPALRRLLDDVNTGKVDVVVVYKIDRLTRSLMDFARIVEIFDGQSVSFVSVTQQFNTTTSMGRLTLNVLLSFAQFEREVTGERIRDKIAASKRKGMWMGGLPPLGYDACDKKLVVNEAEAETVRTLFRLYLEIGSVRQLKVEADKRDLVTKTRRRRDGSIHGGGPFSRGHLYQLLANPMYVGEIACNGETYPGQHQAIVDRPTFDAVQAKLAANRVARKLNKNTQQPALLAGLIFDETGDRLSPTHAVKTGKRYRYYISHRLMQAKRKISDGWRLPAGDLESAVLNEIIQILNDDRQLIGIIGTEDLSPAKIEELRLHAAQASAVLKGSDMGDKRMLLHRLVRKITLSDNRLRIELDREGLGRLILGECVPDEHEKEGSSTITIEKSVQFKRRGVEAKLIVGEGAGPARNIDQNLIDTIANARLWFDQLATGKFLNIDAIAKNAGIPASEVSRAMPIAFLSPRIVEAILDGRQPVDLTAERLKRMRSLPQSWPEQERVLGFRT